MPPAKPVPSLALRIVVLAPPAGVRFAVQRGKAALLAPLEQGQGAIAFELSLRLGAPLPQVPVNWVGEYAQGTPQDRFVYINSGTLAGQADSVWTRRAKLKLADSPAPWVEQALAGQGLVQARVSGCMKAGGPICASVKPQDVVWSFERSGV